MDDEDVTGAEALQAVLELLAKLKERKPHAHARILGICTVEALKVANVPQALALLNEKLDAADVHGARVALVEILAWYAGLTERVKQTEADLRKAQESAATGPKVLTARLQ